VPKRGKYIVIEGGDGTGKTTQAILLDKFIRSLGYDTLQVMNDKTGQLEPIQEPSGTPKANELRRRILDVSIKRTPWENVQWFTEARVSIWNEAIEPALARGQHVITTRSWLSTLAYQGYAEGIPIKEIEAYTREHVGDAYMKPDFVAILAIKEEKTRKARLDNRAHTNSKLDTFESKPAEFQSSIHGGYLQLAEDQKIPIIDAQGSRVKVFREILGYIEPQLEQ
jgi:dTMP kinase